MFDTGDRVKFNEVNPYLTDLVGTVVECSIVVNDEYVVQVDSPPSWFIGNEVLAYESELVVLTSSVV
jgi:hypothetical protein